MKKNFDKIVIAAFFSLLAAVGILFYVIPNRPIVSELENRTLAKKPELTMESVKDGSFMSEYTAYYADNFLFREQLLGFANELRELMHYTGEDSVQLITVDGTGDMSGLGEDERQPVSSSDASGSDAPTAEDEVAPDMAIDGDGSWKNSYLILNDTVLTLPYQTEGSRKSQAQWVELLDETAKRFPEQNIYCGFIPVASAYYLPHQYRTEERDQQAMINNIYDNLSDDVTPIDIYNALAKHADEYIYFRTDHHWTGLGAYYAYGEYARTAGRAAPPALSEFETVSTEGFKGTLYAQTGGNKAMRANPDTVTAYKPPVEYSAVYYSANGYEYDTEFIWEEAKQTYSCFLGGDYPLFVAETENKGGGGVLLIKDSYGNAFAPMLSLSYERVVVADPRYDIPSLGELIEQYDIDDVIFIYNLNNITHYYRTNELRRFIGMK